MSPSCGAGRREGPTARTPSPCTLGLMPALPAARRGRRGTGKRELWSRLSHLPVLTDGSLPREISQLGAFSISPSITSINLQKPSLFGQFFKAGVAPASKLWSGRVPEASVGAEGGGS